MHALFSGLRMLFVFLIAVFCLGNEWMWLLDFVFQLVLFCLLGKIVLVSAFFLAGALHSWRIFCFALAFMLSIFIRWMVRLFLDFRVEAAFPFVARGYGIPYTLICAVLVYLVLSRTSFVDEFVIGARS